MKILVVDDSSFFRNVLTNGLREAGHEVHTAPDGPTALAILEEIEPDLISLDLEMPDMSGFEVCERIREREAEKGKLLPRQSFSLPATTRSKTGNADSNWALSISSPRTSDNRNSSQKSSTLF